MARRQDLIVTNSRLGGPDASLRMTVGFAIISDCVERLIENNTYVLACPRDDGTIAVLCRTNGTSPGPALCNSKKNAIKLKTKLSNDPRGIANHRAMELIKNLYVYKLNASIEPIWQAGSLWAYLPQEKAECVESHHNIFLN